MERQNRLTRAIPVGIVARDRSVQSFFGKNSNHEHWRRIASPAKLTAKLVLKNVSSDQTVRLLSGTITYLDAKGRAIKLEDNRVAPMLKIASGYGSSDRLDPGQDMTQPLEMEFPAEALKAKTLKDIRFGLAYIPSAYKEEALNFPVSIGGQ